jgi:hypothetical protein
MVQSFIIPNGEALCMTWIMAADSSGLRWWWFISSGFYIPVDPLHCSTAAYQSVMSVMNEFVLGRGFNMSTRTIAKGDCWCSKVRLVYDLRSRLCQSRMDFSFVRPPIRLLRLNFRSCWRRRTFQNPSLSFHSYQCLRYVANRVKKLASRVVFVRWAEM